MLSCGTPPPPTHPVLCCAAPLLAMHMCRKQPVKETADKQSSLWGSLILAYCKHNKVGAESWNASHIAAEMRLNLQPKCIPNCSRSHTEASGVGVCQGVQGVWVISTGTGSVAE